MRRVLLTLTLVLGLAGAALAARAGDAAPDINLPRLGGGTVDLRSALASGPVVVWFPDLSGASPQRAAALAESIAGGGGRLLIIPVVGQDATAAADLAARSPDLVYLHDADGSVTLGYAGEFVPGVAPRQNLFIVSPSGRISFCRFWPGVPESTLQAEIRAAR